MQVPTNVYVKLSRGRELIQCRHVPPDSSFP